MRTSDLIEGGARAGEGPLPRPQSGVFGQYQILEALGRGAVGEVFRARGLSGRYQGSQVCLKLLGRRHLDQAAQHGERSRAIQTLRVEAEVLGQMEHPNIARVLEHGLLNDVWFVVFELVEGENLARVLGACAPGCGLPENQVLAVGCQVARALACAHERDVLHRDVKPSNIMIGKDGQVKLVDFGLAKIRAGEASYFSHVGTPPYWAPEQIRCQHLTAAVDVYALGVVLAEAAIGHALFEAHGVDDFSESVIRDGREVDVEALPLSESLRGILAGCLTSEPSARPTAAALSDQLAAALDRFPASQLGEMATRTASTQRRSPLKLSAFGVAVGSGRSPLGQRISTTLSDRHTLATKFVPPSDVPDRVLAAIDFDESFHGSALADLSGLARQARAESDADLPGVGDHEDSADRSAMSTTRVGMPTPSPGAQGSSARASSGPPPIPAAALPAIPADAGPPANPSRMEAPSRPLPPVAEVVDSAVPADGSDNVIAGSVIADSIVENGSTLIGRVAGEPAAVMSTPEQLDGSDLDGEGNSVPAATSPVIMFRGRRRLSTLVTGAVATGLLGAAAAAWSLRDPPAPGPTTGVTAAAQGAQATQAPRSIASAVAAVHATQGGPQVPGPATSPVTLATSTPAVPSATRPVDPPPQKPTAPSSAPRARAVVEQVTIGIIPEGQVWVDGRALGRAPVKLELTRGRHRIVARLGDQEIRRSVRITKGANPIVLDFWHAE